MINLTEEQALRQLKRGSQMALEWFIDRYGGYVAAIIRGIIGQSMTVDDVEEVTSDVFLAFWRGAERIRGGSAKAYLAAAARNNARNKLRQMVPTVPLPEDMVLVDPQTPQRLLEQQEQAAAVRRALLAMEPTDREIFLRFYFYCQKISQIAAAMELKENTVKSRLSRGREKLKASLLEEDAPNEGGTTIWHITSTT